MTTLAPGLQPDIEIKTHTVGGEKSWEISFFAPSTEDLDVQSKQATLRTLLDDSLSLSLAPIANDPLAFDVRVAAPGRDVSIALIKISSARGNELVVLKRDLANALQANFIKALRGARGAAQASQSAALGGEVLPVSQGNDKPGLTRRVVGNLTWKKGVVAGLLLFAVGLVVLGLTPASSLGSLAGGIQPESYASIQAQMKRQIAVAANSDQPAIGALQGQVIAIETMKAMGLDPGKANAGCLVGVKK